MKILNILVIGVALLVFSLLLLDIPLNADAALNVFLKLKEPIKLGATSSGYVLSGPDAEKAMQAINALKRDCCSCSKVEKEINCTWKKGTSDCCANTLKSIQTAIPIKPTKPSAPTGMTISGSPPSAPKGLVITGTTPSHPPPAIGYTPPQQDPIGIPGRRLVIRKSGDGTGTVTSSPSGINCGQTCSASFSSGTVVTLTAAPDSQQVFGRWFINDVPVDRRNPLNVTIDTDKIVVAMFRLYRFSIDRSGEFKCPEGYLCHSRLRETAFYCQWNGSLDCFTPHCINMRDCDYIVNECRLFRDTGNTNERFYRDHCDAF